MHFNTYRKGDEEDMKINANKILALLLALAMTVCVLVGCSDGKEYTLPKESGSSKITVPSELEQDDIVILFTNDVHCGVDDDIGYAGLAAYKNYCESMTSNVTLVDCGDAVQGDLIGAVSDGEYIVGIMNKVGYDLAVLGNHEFDYGMEQLTKLIENSEATYLNANIRYSGSGQNALEATKPYEIINYGDIDVAFIGVSTPYTISSSTPTYFMENGEFVYDFHNGSSEEFYGCIQGYIDECEDKGAEHIVLLTHLGDTEAYSPYSSVDLIENTDGVDAVLDAHEHSTIPCNVEKNKNGENVLLASTGTKLNNIGQLVITASGNVSVGLVSDIEERDEETKAFIDSIKALYETELNTVIAESKVNLTGYDPNGVRLVRNRETNIGNFCADAYRAVAGADIAMVNGGGVRADIKAGDVTYADTISVHPFGNTLCMVEATGQEIVDALEVSMYAVQSDYQSNGAALGENGSFMQVSGVKFTVDTSVASTVQFDENGMLKSIGEQRRVKDVMVLAPDGQYVPIDLTKTYKVASHNYLLADSGCGHNIFGDNVFLIDRAMSDYEILITYLKNHLNGVIGEQYATTEGRINVR